MWLGVIRGATSRRAEGGRGGGCCAQEVLSTPFSWRMSLNYLTGVWLKHIHLLSLCLAVEGMDGIWVMDMQTTNSLVEHTACSQKELLLRWGIFLGSCSGTLDALVPAARGGADVGRMCPCV